MNKKELIELLSDESIPDHAEIYVESDHGQCGNQASSVTFSGNDPEYSAEDMCWGDWFEDEDDPDFDEDEGDFTSEITAVKIW